MKVEQTLWKTPHDAEIINRSEAFDIAHLVMVFGSRDLLTKNDYIHNITQMYPSAHIIGCSTAGEIIGTEVLDNIVTSTAIYFEHTSIENVCVSINTPEESYNAGTILAAKLNKPNLAHVFVISDGLNINASELVKSMKHSFPDTVSVTGGVAGDGILFEKTLVIDNGVAKENIVSAIGFYGDRLQIGYGSIGGWDTFGPERLITKSKNNILYELDGKPALELYKLYLGKYANDLPSSGLLFPLSIRAKDNHEGIVRTMLKINDEDQGMFFAGDVPEGYYGKLMKANFDRLINGALEAAELSMLNSDSSPSLAILISCVGRKVVLKQRIEEEVEVVREVLGSDCIFTGFYSYGEICPYTKITYTDGNTTSVLGTGCELHNQTMTITTFKEL